MANRPIKIGVVAGEASGDILAAGLLSRILEKHPDAIIEGIAGPKMLALGCKSLFDMEELSVMGLVEILPKVRRILHIRKQVYQHFISSPPDVFIGVDAPDFNLGLEKKLKAQGIKTVHYVSPTIWIWRENRIYGIKEATNLVLSIFPQEKPIYDQHAHPCKYVGHTMADNIPLAPDKELARKELGFGADAKILAILPGSRNAEIKSLLDAFMRGAEIVSKQIEDIVVVIPAANENRKKQIELYLSEQQFDFDIRVLSGEAQKVMIASDAILLASGTATLEAMLCKRPMVVAYRINWLTHQIMKLLYKARFFSLPNLLADKEIVPELFQEQVNPQTISEHLIPLLKGEKTQDIEAFTQLHESLRKGADLQSADAVLELISASK